MDFNDLLHDIAKLEGLHLSSIRPGADIVVEKVDIEHGKVLVKNASGKLFSRSVIEFQKIWEGLNTEPAVRVEEILRGSGSSRNQPETIFANLPYIEWLKITNKKHISFVGKQTHPFGTIKQMDAVNASNLQLHVAEQTAGTKSIIVCVTNRLFEDTKDFSRICGISPTATALGHYKYSLEKNNVYFIDARSSKINEGTYFETDSAPFETSDNIVLIDGTQYCFTTIGNIKVVSKKNNR